MLGRAPLVVWGSALVSEVCMHAIYSFVQFALSSCCVPGIVLETGVTTASKTARDLD